VGVRSGADSAGVREEELEKRVRDEREEKEACADVFELRERRV